MKTCFILRVPDSPYKIAIADLCDYYNLGLLITRINVPEEFRGKAYGSRLLTEIVEAADASKTRLFLEISPSGPLNYNELESWYMRYGFKKWRGIYRRIPRQG